MDRKTNREILFQQLQNDNCDYKSLFSLLKQLKADFHESISGPHDLNIKISSRIRNRLLKNLKSKK